MQKKKRGMAAAVVQWSALAAILAGGGNPCFAQEYDEELSRIGSTLVECLKEAKTVRVATVDFTDLQGTVTELGRLLAEELSTELAMQSRASSVQIIDRAHLNRVLKELELTTESGWFDPETVRKIGQFAGLDVLVTGNVLALENSMRMTVKAIATDTAAIGCAARGNLPKTMALREMLSIGIGAPGAVPRDSVPAATDTGKSPEPGPSRHGPLEIRLTSITKTKDGKKVQVVMKLAVVGIEEAARLTLDPNNLPILLDNTGSDWTLAKVAGISIDEPHGQIHTWTAFEPDVEYPLSFVFTTDRSTDGSIFSFTGVFQTPSRNPYRPTNIPVGFVDLRIR